MQKYVVVQFLEKIAEGTEFSSSNWPLHVTIAPNFTIDLSQNNLLDELSTFLAAQCIATASAGDDAHFGSQKNIQVTVLRMSDELITLHDNLITFLESKSAVFDEPQYIKEGYRAHVTVTENNSRVDKSEHIGIDALTIIDMFPNEDIKRRKVLKTITLGRPA